MLWRRVGTGCGKGVMIVANAWLVFVEEEGLWLFWKGFDASSRRTVGVNCGEGLVGAPDD